MRAVIQRVKKAVVKVQDEITGSIEKGLLVFVGVEKGDKKSDIEYITSKVCGLRIFEDSHGKMNLDVQETNGSILIVSQFTIAGDVRKGRRPSFTGAEEPLKAKIIYNEVIRIIKNNGIKVRKGIFQAAMEVELINDGPVTILLDSKKTF